MNKEDKKMNKEDIIDNYIEHIRNMSELTDDEIESVIDEAIEDDEELFDVLEKFLEKRHNIREKVVRIEIETNEDKEEKRKEIDGILEAFDDPDCAYPLEDIIESLKDSGYADPGIVIVDAIGENILCVDSIENDETMYLALTKEGETLWELHNSD